MKEDVYYRREDYAGFWWQAMMDIVIMAVLWLALIAAQIS